MKHSKKVFFVLALAFSVTSKGKRPIDATIVSNILFADGLARHAITIFEHLNKELSLNHIKTHLIDWTDVPPSAQYIIKKKKRQIGNVALFFNLLWTPGNNNAKKFMPNSLIKIAYTMLESTEIPQEWVDILNSLFDAAVVPDPFFVDVYRNCGVTIPIFMVPCPISLKDFLNQPLKSKPNDPFVFGMSGGPWRRKNHDLLLQAFTQEFGEVDNIQLKIHTRVGNYRNSTAKEYENITLINKKLRQKAYVDFLSGLDCYVFLSKGEGFSIIPREALALGIPCILSDNTAQKTICDSGFVYPVEANIIEPAYYKVFKKVVGNQFNVTIQDARKAMRDVYENYQYYLQKAPQGREWAKQYDFENVKKTFINLLKPKKVLLGTQNMVTEEYLMTNSKTLYQKYRQI